ncbi:MAG: hypothetical protein R3C49_15100 [Planctomycetaceae bacterium]
MTEPPGTPEDNLRRVREKVMQLAREIEQMSGENIPPTTYFPEFLTRVVAAIGARAGAVWVLAEGGRLQLAAEVNLQETRLREIPGAAQKNEKLLIDVLQTGEAKTITHGQGVELPTEHIMVLSALHREKECVGVVQLFQRTDVPEKARSGYMQFLEQMCGYASRYIEGKRRNAPMSDDLKSKFWTDFEQFTLRIQRSLEEQEVADASASDGRPLLGCDRLSIVTKKGSSVKVRAVSGQSTVNPRANLVVAMQKLARRIVASGETLLYAGKIEGLAPQIEKPLANFVQESGSRMIMMVPLFQNDVLVREQGEDAERKRKTKRPKAIGCLVIEQVAESEPAPELERRAELLADHIGASLWNARQHGRIFGRSIFKFMGTVLEWFQGKKLAITTAVLLAVGGVIAAGALVKMQYPVEANGKLMPVEQHAVFAQWDGTIERVLVQPDERGEYRVAAGQDLLLLTNDELEEEIVAAQAELEKQIQLEDTTTRTRNAVPRTEFEQRHQLEIKLITIQADLEIAKAQLKKLLDRKHDKLIVRAPAAGVIADFQRMEILLHRPVRAGDHLFDIMNDDPDAAWHMELLVEEKRMGHISKAIEERKTKAGGSAELQGLLDGQFTIVSHPDTKFDCTLTTIATRSTIDSELGTAFELFADAKDDAVLPTKRIGTEVTVRLFCGECSLAYWCFGDVVEFVQRQLWWF